MSTASDVLNAAMSLSHEQRSEIVHRLLLSLEPEPSDEGVDQAWAEEIRRRRRAIRQGEAKLRDWDEAVLAIRQTFATPDTA